MASVEEQDIGPNDTITVTHKDTGTISSSDRPSGMTSVEAALDRSHSLSIPDFSPTSPSYDEE